MKQDKRRKAHPLYAGQPDHVLKLRQSAEAQRRLKERRDWKVKQEDKP